MARSLAHKDDAAGEGAGLDLFAAAHGEGVVAHTHAHAVAGVGEHLDLRAHRHMDLDLVGAVLLSRLLDGDGSVRVGQAVSDLFIAGCVVGGLVILHPCRERVQFIHHLLHQIAGRGGLLLDLNGIRAIDADAGTAAAAIDGLFLGGCIGLLGSRQGSRALVDHFLYTGMIRQVCKPLLVDLLKEYDMFVSSGRDYHFYITDASGDGRVIEYDCDSETRELVDTRSEAVTNFFVLYKDKVAPNQKNGIYGHGRERYDAVLKTFEAETEHTNSTVWNALKASSQDPNPTDITSNTQWSINYNNTDLTAEIALRRNWDDKTIYNLSQNKIELPN